MLSVRWARRGLCGAAAMVIAFVTLVAASDAARADDPDLGVSGRTRLVHDPSTALVRARSTVTVTNRKPSTATMYYFYDGYTFAVPAGARNVRATSGGNRLQTSLKESPDPSLDLLLVYFPSRLLYGQSLTLELRYDIAGAKPRSENPIRIGAGYGTFPAVSPGDAGRNELEIVIPAEMTWDSPEADLFVEEPGDDPDRLTLVATETNTPDGIIAAFSAQSPVGLLTDRAQVAGQEIEIRFWPGDQEWATKVAQTLTSGVPALEKLTGSPWPDEIRTIREDSGTRIFGYDGYYEARDREIVLSDSYEPHLILHELAHAWSNSTVFEGRWMSEGLADYLATRAAADLKVRDDPFDTVRRNAKHSLPLDDWTWPDDGISGDVDGYGYPASAQAMAAIFGDATAEQLSAVIDTVSKGQSAYDPAEARLLDDQTTTRRFLDIVESHIPGDAPSKAYRTWVVPASEAAVLKDRSASRKAWRAIDDADGEWRPPIAYRRALTDWDFKTADSLASDIEPVADLAGRTADAAADAGVPVPEFLRSAYEDADDGDDVAAAARLLAKAPESVVAIADAEESVEAAEEDGPLVAFAAEQLGVRADLDAANAQLRSGEGDPAALARRASDRAGWAMPLAIGGLAGSLVLAFGLVWAVGRVLRRVRRRA